LTNRWLRQAGALVLVFVIGVAFLLKPTAIAWAGRIAVEDKVSAKSSLSRPSDSGPIFDSPYEIEERRARLNVSDLGRIQNASVAHRESDGDARPDWISAASELVGSRSTGDIRIIIWRALGEFTPAWNYHCEIIDICDECWSVADVYHVKSDFDWIVPDIVAGYRGRMIASKPYMLQSHMWSMGRDEFLCGEFDGFIGGAQHASSGPPESSCESSDGKCGKSSNEGAVTKGFSDLPPRDQNYVIRGAIFFVLCASLLAYGCFKWAEHQDANGQQDKRKQTDNGSAP